MSRYVIFSGFLGAGKTTVMMAVANEMKKRGLRAGIVVNDLGRRDLVDREYTAALGYAVEMIHGGCICFLQDELLEKIGRFRDEEGADLILSDIPGCGIGALKLVYHSLAKEHAGAVVLAPFTAVADPVRLGRLLPVKTDLQLPAEMDFLFDAQLKEAEVILLNKIDTLTPERTAELVTFLEKRYPQAKVFVVSAKTGAGISVMLDWLMTHTSALPDPYLGKDTPAFEAAEEKLSWYDCQFRAEARDGGAFSGNDFCAALAEAIRAGLAAAGRNVPHLKLMAESGNGEFVKLSLIGIDLPLSVDAGLTGDCRSLSVIVNARATCEAPRLTAVCDMALQQAAKTCGVKAEVTFTECFNMMDD